MSGSRSRCNRSHSCLRGTCGAGHIVNLKVTRVALTRRRALLHRELSVRRLQLVVRRCATTRRRVNGIDCRGA